MPWLHWRPSGLHWEVAVEVEEAVEVVEVVEVEAAVEVEVAVEEVEGEG